MVHIEQERFPKAHRLRKRWEFLAVQGSGKKFSSRFFIGLALPRSEEGPARIGITASGRFGNAVVRNHIRRLIREAFRTHRFHVPSSFDVVIIPKKHAALEPSAGIFEDLESLGRRIAQSAEGRP